MYWLAFHKEGFLFSFIYLIWTCEFHFYSVIVYCHFDACIQICPVGTPSSAAATHCSLSTSNKLIQAHLVLFLPQSESAIFLKEFWSLSGERYLETFAIGVFLFPGPRSRWSWGIYIYVYSNIYTHTYICISILRYIEKHQINTFDSNPTLQDLF